MHPSFRRSALFALLSPALAFPLTAQTQVTVPANADLADGHQSHGLPFGAPGFRTQILVDAAAVASTTGVVFGLQFRVDRASAPLAQLTVPNVTISISQTTVPILGLGPTFAANVTGTPTVVYQGAVALPAQGAGLSGPLPWNVAIAFPSPYVFATAAGNLLVDIVANNAPNAVPRYWLDAVEAGGSATGFGAPGDNPSFDQLRVIVSTGNDLVPTLIAPGGFVDFTSTLSFTTPPGVLALGFAPLVPPLDLGPLGAPTHTVYVTPLAMFAHSWTSSFIGYYSTVSVSIPNNPAVRDVRVYGQSFLLEPTANAAGLLASAAVETLIGDNQLPLPLQQVDALDPQAATGTVLDFGTPSNPRFGAVAIRFDGLFQ